MRGSSEDFYKIALKKDPPHNEAIANILCDFETYLEHGKIPDNWEEVLDVVIDYIREHGPEERDHS